MSSSYFAFREKICFHNVLLGCVVYGSSRNRSSFHLEIHLVYIPAVYTPGEYCNRLSKGKAVPLQAWSGPEGSTKLRFPDFMTTAQDGGKVVSLTHRPPLPPGNTPGTHFC